MVGTVTQRLCPAVRLGWRYCGSYPFFLFFFPLAAGFESKTLLPETVGYWVVLGSSQNGWPRGNARVASRVQNRNTLCVCVWMSLLTPLEIVAFTAYVAPLSVHVYVVPTKATAVAASTFLILISLSSHWLDRFSPSLPRRRFRPFRSRSIRDADDGSVHNQAKFQLALSRALEL
jgi:hypothetical protein